MDRTAKLIIVGYCVISVLLAALLPLPVMTRLFQDDAFFYFSIARNFAEGKGSTFDGLHLTNGYHPLWLLLLAAFDRVVPLRGLAGLRGVLLLDSLLFALSLIVFAKLLVKTGLSSPLRQCVLVALVCVLGFANFGMEAAIWLLSFALFAFALFRVASETCRPIDYVYAGLATAACYLSRVDSILFILPMAGYATYRLFQREASVVGSLKAGAAVWAPLAISIVAQVALNLKYFGTVKSISSELKTNAINFSFALLKSSDERGLQPLIHRAVFLAVLASATCVLVLLVRKMVADERERDWRNLLIGANAYVCVFCLAALLTLHEPPRTWYYTIAFAALIVSVAYLIQGAAQKGMGNPRLGLAYAATFFVSLVSVAGLLVQYKLSPHENQLGLAAWLKLNMEPDTAAFVKDGSGIINYFSEKPVIDGDGLVNDFEYKRSVEEHGLEKYMSQNRVSIVIANVIRSPLPPVVDLYSPGWHSMREYPFAHGDTDNALATFTQSGYFGYVVFRTSQLRFEK